MSPAWLRVTTLSPTAPPQTAASRTAGARTIRALSAMNARNWRIPLAFWPKTLYLVGQRVADSAANWPTARRGRFARTPRWAHNPEVAGSNPAPATSLFMKGSGTRQVVLTCGCFGADCISSAVSALLRVFVLRGESDGAASRRGALLCFARWRRDRVHDTFRMLGQLDNCVAEEIAEVSLWILSATSRASPPRSVSNWTCTHVTPFGRWMKWPRPKITRGMAM